MKKIIQLSSNSCFLGQTVPQYGYMKYARKKREQILFLSTSRHATVISFFILYLLQYSIFFILHKYTTCFFCNIKLNYFFFNKNIFLNRNVCLNTGEVNEISSKYFSRRIGVKVIRPLSWGGQPGCSCFVHPIWSKCFKSVHSELYILFSIFSCPSN